MAPKMAFLLWGGGGLRGGGGGLAQGHGVDLSACGGSYWPLSTVHSDPLPVRTPSGCVNRTPALCGCGDSASVGVGSAEVWASWLVVLRWVLGLFMPWWLWLALWRSASPSCRFPVASVLWSVMLSLVALETKSVPTSGSCGGCVRHQ